MEGQKRYLAVLRKRRRRRGFWGESRNVINDPKNLPQKKVNVKSLCKKFSTESERSLLRAPSSHLLAANLNQTHFSVNSN